MATAAIDLHALQENDQAYLYARSNIARSGASRANYTGLPFLAYLYAQANVARSGATRSNHTAPTVFISISGIQYGEGRAHRHERVLLDSLTITDSLNEDANTLSMRTKGFVPAVGAEVIITLGSANTGRREFGGRIAQTVHTYWDNPAQDEYNVSAIDFTWGLNTRKVTGRYTGSATDIARALIAEWAPGYTAPAVADGLPLVDGGITFTHQELTDCLTQLAKRVGASWYIDYFRGLHLFLTETAGTDPRMLTLAHPTARELAIRRDATQWVTRALVEGGGVTLLAAVAPGEPFIPLETIAWYPAAGGLVTAGPQRVRYSGVFVGGGGSLVGPGAAPVVAPAGSVVSGTGIDPGPHEYAVSYVTATGESLPGPRLALQVGAISPPPTALVLGSPALGLGPDPGAHSWTVTFVTALGETLVGPIASATIPPAPVPLSAPAPGPPGFGGALAPGSYAYLVTFVTPAGESTAGPASPPVTMVQTGVPNAPAPSIAGNGPSATVGNLTVGHTYGYTVVWSTASGQTTHSAQTAAVAFANVPALASTASIPNAGAPSIAANGPSNTEGDLTPGHTYRYGVCYSTAAGQTVHSEQTALVSTVAVNCLPSNTNPAKSSHILIDVPYGPDGVQWVHLYRVDQTLINPSNPSDYRRVASFANVATSGSTRFTDTLANTAIAGNDAPTGTNTAYAGRSSHILIDVPYGPAGTQWCHLYRVDQTLFPGNNPPDYRLLASFANVATSGSTRFTDTLANAAIAGNSAPTGTNTTYSWTTTVPLTGIEVGPTGTTARRLYRSSGGAHGLVATIANNSSTTMTDTGAAAGAPPPTTNTAGQRQVALSQLPIGGPDVTGRRIYRTAANAAVYKLALTIADNAQTTATDTVPDASLGAAPPSTATAIAAKVQLTTVPLGPAAVTQRKVYRTKAYGSSLLLVATLGDNTTVTYTDTTADAALGSAPPPADTSGLKQPEGAVNAGATVIPVAGAGWARAGGGWVVIGNGQQVVRYQAASGNTLTGIPAAGTGAITATISYNSSITAAPMLTGIPAAGAGAIRFGLLPGDDINLLVIVDDAASQAALAAQIGGDGIQEEFLQDRRLSADESYARGQALLRLHNGLDIAVHFTSRDLNSQSGRRLVVNLGAPYNLTTELKIQRTTSTYALAGHRPTYTVEASSALFAFEDLLRQARLTRGT